MRPFVEGGQRPFVEVGGRPRRPFIEVGGRPRDHLSREGGHGASLPNEQGERPFVERGDLLLSEETDR
jgi:hypothetical protein